jgi:hypothetical protein
MLAPAADEPTDELRLVLRRARLLDDCKLVPGRSRSASRSACCRSSLWLTIVLIGAQAFVFSQPASGGAA